MPPRRASKPCEDYKQCTLNPDIPIAKPARPPTFEDVDAYFTPSAECSISIIALNALDKPLYRTKVKFSKREHCATFFAQFGSYYYVYHDLLNSIIVWSDTHALGGRIGEHISIGQKDDGTFDVHDTLYTTFKQDEHYRIARKEHRFYKYDNISYQLMAHKKKRGSWRKGDPHYGAILWNDILHTMNNTLTTDGSQSGGVHTDLGVKNRGAQAMNIREIFEVIQQRVYQIDIPDIDKYAVFIRVPYISRKKEASAAKRLEALARTARKMQNATIVSNHFSQQSVLCVNTSF